MKSSVAGLIAMLALSGNVHAQNGPTGYVAGVAQSSFSNVTSQSFGIEGGWYYTPRLAIFAEFGGMRDTSPSTIGPAAQVVANYLGAVQSAPVSYSVKQPVAFVAAGARYTLIARAAVHPYALVAVGGARVTRDVKFMVGNTDVTERLDAYGVVLGTDLAGSTTKPLVTFGGGVTWQPKGAWVFDAGYRFSRILTDNAATSVNRLGIGIGYTF
jgi:opacity protein-like surface antigen